MTDDTSKTVDINTDDLDAFEDVFFNKTKTVEVEEVEDVVDEEEEVADLGEDENDPPAPEDDEDDEDEEPEEEPKAKKKNRNSFQERIDELTAKARNEEREKLALLKRLEELEAAVREKEVKEEAPSLKEALPADAPQPDAVDKNGNPLYELGEFDPKYIRDLTKFTIAEETKAAKAEAEKAEQEKAAEAAQKEIQDKWLSNLEAVEETLPDIREKVAGLATVFEGIEPNYGEYLASAVMSSDYGPQIMYHLSQNIGEAQKIVASGPAAATLALGRLEAKFILSAEREEQKRNTKQVSKASPPPEARARGTNGKFAIAPDTDDLDAFEREFFNKR